MENIQPTTSAEGTKQQLEVSGLQHSQSVHNIAVALATAQGEMSGASKDSENPFFKSHYADLAAVVRAIRAPLSKAKIAHVQCPGSDEKGEYLDTMLIHESGQWLKGRIRMKPVKADPQGIGSVISYMRRYALQAMVGLEAADDDGNGATGSPQKKMADRKPLSPGKVESEAQNATAWKHYQYGGKELGQYTDDELRTLWVKYADRTQTTVDGKLLKGALVSWHEEYEAEMAASTPPV